ncbi:Isochorismatase hydrolase [Xylaria sp. FL1042]|nr:Isochorismatase hydrolase [Xylaria sp. FL1042]
MSSKIPYELSPYPPSQTALLFLDYQNYLVNMVPSPTNESLCNAVKTLLATARETTSPKVVAAWGTQYKPLLSANPQLGLDTNRETVHMRKPGLRSVLEPEVVAYLRERLGVNHSILAGIIATSGAVMGTTSHGTDINFVISVVPEACCGPSAETHDDLINIVIPTLA